MVDEHFCTPDQADLGEARAFEARARARLLAEPPGAPTREDPLAGHGDHRLSPGLIDPEAALRARAAAVLVPVVDRAEGAALLLTKRAAHLRTHAGQIAFPGGRIDPEDPSVLEAALREAEEEVGLDRALVRLVGYGDAYLSGSGFHIIPVVALVEPAYRLVINRDEVEEAFEVPLSSLMTPGNHERRMREHRSGMREAWAMPHGERVIWGVTAGIIRSLYERIYA